MFDKKALTVTEHGRGERIRTSGLIVPKPAIIQLNQYPCVTVHVMFTHDFLRVTEPSNTKNHKNEPPILHMRGER